MLDKIAVILLFGLVAGCASTESVENDLLRFVGKNIKDAVAELGKPTHRYNMQNGTWQYHWTRQSSFSSSTGTSFLGVPLTKTKRKECSRVLIVDGQKNVVDYAIEGKC